MIRLILPSLIIYALTSCGGPSTTALKRADSVNISMALTGDTVPIKELKQVATFSMLDIKRLAAQPIPADSAQNMVSSYHTPRHRLNLVNSAGEPLKGFVLEADDFKKIVANAANIKSLSFYFGVHNFAEAYTGNVPAKYTLLIVPVDKTGKAMKNSVFDYVLPCPTNCPGDGFEPKP